MSVSFEDFLKSAEVLLSNSKSEIDFRNLMSRSYYALFHLAREKSINLPVQKNKYGEEPKGSHEKVIIRFEQHTDKDLRKIGFIMNQRKKARCKADYDIHEHILSYEAKQHFFVIKDLITKLEQLNPN